MTKSISWQEHFERCAASGQSKRKYCDQHNISYKSFFYHQRKRERVDVGTFQEVPVALGKDETQMEYHFLNGTHLRFPASALRLVFDLITTR
jgi:hypothetical protein